LGGVFGVLNELEHGKTDFLGLPCGISIFHPKPAWLFQMQFENFRKYLEN